MLAWLIDEKVYVGWCGDSRAYKYNPSRGFVQLSHDHSYVQELVDSGKLSPELAFDHPNNNIITRSLGDPRGVAQPDVKVFSLEEYDVIMLCSDGLCGVLRDHEMEQLISGHQSSMVSCRDALWEAARNAGWHDNVTIALAQIMPQKARLQVAQSSESKPIEKPIKKNDSKKCLKIGLVVLAVLLGVLALVWAYNKFFGSNDEKVTNPEKCGQYEELVKKYESLNPLDDKSEILEKVQENIIDIKKCDNLRTRVSRKTEQNLEDIQSRNLDKGVIGDVLQNLNQLKESLNN